jgi:hypothetical protein
MFETFLWSQRPGLSQTDVTLAKINMDCPMLICVAPAMPSRVFATNELFPFLFEFALDFVFAEGFPSASWLADPELSDESLPALTRLGF